LIAKHGAERFNSHVKLLFPPWSTLGVLGIVFVSMALKAPDIVRAPAGAAGHAAAAVAAVCAELRHLHAGRRALFPRGEAIALVFGTVMRNLSIALAIAIGIFREQGADAALLISLAYIVQVQSAAWYVRFTDRLFGQPAAPAARAA
jgi:arsenite transporter